MNDPSCPHGCGHMRFDTETYRLAVAASQSPPEVYVCVNGHSKRVDGHLTDTQPEPPKGSKYGAIMSRLCAVCGKPMVFRFVGERSRKYHIGKCHRFVRKQVLAWRRRNANWNSESFVVEDQTWYRGTVRESSTFTEHEHAELSNNNRIPLDWWEGYLRSTQGEDTSNSYV